MLQTSIVLFRLSFVAGSIGRRGDCLVVRRSASFLDFVSTRAASLGYITHEACQALESSSEKAMGLRAVRIRLHFVSLEVSFGVWLESIGIMPQLAQPFPSSPVGKILNCAALLDSNHTWHSWAEFWARA